MVISLLCAATSAWGQSLPPSRAASVIDSMPHVKDIDEAVISPDGTQVAYIIGGELAVVSASGGSARPIAVEGKLALREVSWSPDSRQIAFLADLPGDVPAAQVFTAALDGSAPVKRAEVKGYASAPTFSPDGSKLALLFIEGMPRVAGPVQPMTPLAGVIDDKVYEQRLTTIDLATNTLAQVTPADVYVYEYDWTPDGQGWVATAAHGSGDANWYIAKLYQINSQSGEMREIYAPKWQIAEPHISPDGKNVVFIEGLMSDEGVTGGDVYVVPTAGGTPRNLTPKINSSPSSLAWTGPDQITFAENVDGKSGFVDGQGFWGHCAIPLDRRGIPWNRAFPERVLLPRWIGNGRGAAIGERTARSLGWPDWQMEAVNYGECRSEASLGRDAQLPLDATERRSSKAG